MKVKKSEIQLLIAVLGVLLVVVTYFLVYAKFNELSDSMESQNMSLRSQVSTLEVLDQRKADYLAATEKMKTYVANISFGTTAEVAYDAQASADNSALAAATADAPADTAAAEADAAVSGTDTTTVTTSPVSTEGTAYGDTHMYEVPLGISIECTYDDFKGLVRYIYNQQERQSIQGVNISYNGDDGKLSGNMNLNTYYLLGTDKVYGEPYIPDMPMGVQTIFGNVN